jgi:hypothetical protein
MSRFGKLLAFGNGGHSIHYSNAHLSGYDRPETFDGWNDVENGCPVLDKRPAIATPEGYRWVFKGPMVSVDLVDAEVSKCPDLADNMMVQAMQTDGSNTFGALATLQMAHSGSEPGPLDFVSIRQYIDGWRRFGARVGVVQNGKIVWE